MANPQLPLASMRSAAEAQRGERFIRLKLETITPVYGGGTSAGQCDPLVPFRPRAIKNGIRHWWWLLNRFLPQYRVEPNDDPSTRLAKKQLLYDDMVAIWGGAARDEQGFTAKVSVEIDEVPAVKSAPYSAYKIQRKNGNLQLQDDSSAPWLYALFGARGERTPGAQLGTHFQTEWVPTADTFAGRFDTPEARKLAEQEQMFKFAPEDGLNARKTPRDLILPGARFGLSIRWSASLSAEQFEQVKTALAFWLAFGGVGARTSRGLGRVSWDAAVFDAWFRVQGVSSAPGAGMNLVAANLAGRDISTSDTSSPEASTRWVLDAYRNFRQSRNAGGARPGRSHWHKAEAVRRATPTYSYPRHRTRLAAPFTRDEIPEMLFGAPIIVSYQGNDDPDGAVEIVFAEPSGGAPLNRYASPLFFGSRPVVGPNGNKCWQPQALYLHALLDFTGSKLDVRIKAPGPHGATRANITAGTWWTDFDSPTRAVDQVARTAAFGAMPKPTGATSMISVFLRQVSQGKAKP